MHLIGDSVDDMIVEGFSQFVLIFKTLVICYILFLRSSTMALWLRSTREKEFRTILMLCLVLILRSSIKAPRLRLTLSQIFHNLFWCLKLWWLVIYYSWGPRQWPCDWDRQWRRISSNIVVIQNFGVSFYHRFYILVHGFKKSTVGPLIRLSFWQVWTTVSLIRHC